VCQQSACSAAPPTPQTAVTALTDEGRAVLDACRAGIRAMEKDFLAAVPPAKRRTFIEVLDQLADGEA
jgi:hypothetical protein